MYRGASLPNYSLFIRSIRVRYLSGILIFALASGVIIFAERSSVASQPKHRIVLIVGGGIALGVNLLPPRHVKARTSYDPSVYKNPDFLATVHRADSSFQQLWTTENVTPAKVADELTIARRLSLGLLGTVPSLEEIRQFETMPPGERIPWWIDHLLQDRRFADYFGERLAKLRNKGIN